ncbi:hypothetical protein RvY_16905 [Ramazzottius varieornatus]|uniref:G-protein coupled receptors family 1 profile domain-containing protein n=1 Tax=Ramazzottius varieornatus TaxID=947166 RepID=A0A1D1W064_RAMVA|nr:hypothetical protein RvY_16905 [Ramazzottius varieornatus]
MVNLSTSHGYETNGTLHFNKSTTLYQREYPWIWNFANIFQLGGKLFALIFNGLLLLFCKCRTVRNPFNLYVLNLTLANLSSIVVMYPYQVFDQLNRTYFSSVFRCFFYRYLTYTIPGWIHNAHRLIALNRLWALVFPISYRNYGQAHFATRPLFVCCAMLVYLHAVLVPVLIADYMIPRFPL